MTKEQVQKFIQEAYGIEADFPFSPPEDTAVFRHKDTRKWFGIIMEIPKSRLGDFGEEKVFVMNLKCDTCLAGSLHTIDGIFPAYHMNKEHWISVLLDGTVPKDLAENLIDTSFRLTGERNAKGKRQNAK